MSRYVCHLPPISYFDFKIAYYKDFPNSNYRFGQALINSFIKREDNTADYTTLWNTYNMEEAETIFFDIINKCDWDMMALIPVRKI